MSLKMLLATISTLGVGLLAQGGASAEEPAKPAPAPTPPPPVVVQPGDTLEKIAAANSTTYVRLYNANGHIADPDVIHPGENVRIPAPDEQLPDRPLPSNAPAPVASAPTQYIPRRAAAQPTAYNSGGNVSGGAWDRLAQCEAGGNWAANTGNGYYGGLQFSASTWRSVGGSGLPSDASKEEQIARAEMLRARSGYGPWPACSAKLGL
jgi:resuscitation-promoting factor RpfB